MRVAIGWIVAAPFVLTVQLAAAADFRPDLSQLESIPLAMVRAPLAKQIEAAADKSQPFQFAVPAPLTVTLADGIWDQTDADTLRWRMRISSPGAQTLNFEFSKFHLPQGAALWIYDAAGELVQGPYTSANETSSGKLWTAIVLGEQAVLELRVPTALRDEVRLELESVGHGFRGFGKAGTGLGASGACNIDVVCPQGNNWRAEIRSVALISIGGNILCTGQLVNNVRQNRDPLFLTANHCGIVDQTAASSVVFYWNFQNSTCGGRDAQMNQSQPGSTLLAHDASSDFTLLKMNAAPVAHDPAAYFAGWNASSAIPQSGAAFHHPSGDAKKLAIVSTPATRTHGTFNGTDTQFWEVTYSAGTTEPGSSGSGLFDENRQIVGVLSEGTAACSTANPTQNNGLTDDYGRLEVAWNSKPATDQQLKAWLDPDNSGALTLAGLDTSTTPPPPSGGSGGGGALSPAWLLLAAAAAWRRRSIKVH